MPIKFDLKKYKNPVFIETGTLHGEGIQKALNAGFEKIYSIEISPRLYNEACEKFKNNEKVNLILGDSSEELEKIIKTINDPITFWLDAHKDNPYVSKMMIECPLYKEIEIISNHHKKEHTIMIDDIRLLGHNGTWAENLNESELMCRIMKINKNYKLTFADGYVKGDVMIFFI